VKAFSSANAEADFSVSSIVAIRDASPLGDGERHGAGTRQRCALKKQRAYSTPKLNAFAKSGMGTAKEKGAD
jgi:hypothetical protein